MKHSCDQKKILFQNLSKRHHFQTSKFIHRNISFQILNEDGCKEVQVSEITSGQQLQSDICKMEKEDWDDSTKKEVNPLNLQGKLLHVTTSQVFWKINLNK